MFPLNLRVEKRLIEARVSEWSEKIEPRTVTDYYGPCFVCEKETKYLDFWRKDGQAWLEKQFKPKRRERHLETLFTGKFHGTGEYVLATLEKFVCNECRIACEQARNEQRRVLRETKAREERERKRNELLTRWRDPSPNSFDRSTVRREFAIYSKQSHIASVLFRARVCLSQPCRGNSPAYRVGMWSEGKLLAHYNGWELEELRGFAYPDGESDLFGPGLARWIELRFQAALIGRNPEVVWYAQAPVFGRREDAHWNGCWRLTDIGDGCMPEPCLVHSIGPDGSIYASLRNFYTWQQVAEFAEEKLGIEILNRSTLSLPASHP